MKGISACRTAILEDPGISGKTARRAFHAGKKTPAVGTYPIALPHLGTAMFAKELWNLFHPFVPLFDESGLSDFFFSAGFFDESVT